MTHIGRIKVIKEDEDIMDCICICPHCGNKELYGNMLMISGIHGCPNCHEELWHTINYDREHHYDTYVRKANNHEYEPYKYVEEIKDYSVCPNCGSHNIASNKDVSNPWIKCLDCGKILREGKK